MAISPEQSALLDRIPNPAALRGLPESELQAVADAVRAEMIDAVSITGGHLGSGLGVVELTVAILIAARPFMPRASALGSSLAVGMFLTTLSFLVTTPGVWAADAGGFPALSAIPGQFLIKDLALLGISLWSLGESWKASARAAT